MSTPSLVIHRAHGFMSRLAGLLTRPPLRENEALYLVPCAGVHTFFMRYSIDVAFVNHEGQVIAIVNHLKPFRMASCWRAHGAVEFAAGEAARQGIAEGSRLAIGPAAGASA